MTVWHALLDAPERPDSVTWTALLTTAVGAARLALGSSLRELVGGAGRRTF